MFRNILRTSRWLERRRINNFNVVSIRTYSGLTTLRKFSNNTSPFGRQYLSNKSDNNTALKVDASFDHICNETLESLCEYFEELIERAPNLKGADVIYGDGVLTVYLGQNYGTYVINRQSPNKQIWLSSPTSGPKRYDLILKDGGYWVYKHDGVALHRLLQNEISKIAEASVDFKNCAHSLL